MTFATVPSMHPPVDAPAYWEARARRFAAEGEGLRAVCSYGMPAFYNASIHLCQRRALGPWLDPEPGSAALDVGCGVGRWSRLLARRGARVTGVDLSPTMAAEARRRAAAAGLAGRCRFEVADLAELDLGERFPLIVGVTVLQHVLEPARLASAAARLADHLAPGGRAVLLEAAPTAATARCDSAVFRARTSGEYLRLFADAGLHPEAVTGVDPAPFKVLLLPSYNRWPRPLGVAALAAATALALPVDLALGRRWTSRSWHKVFVLRRSR